MVYQPLPNTSDKHGRTHSAPYCGQGYIPLRFGRGEHSYEYGNTTTLISSFKVGEYICRGSKTTFCHPFTVQVNS